MKSGLDSGLQSKLLHFLQDGFFSRLGDNTERTVDTRVICATSRRLEEKIRSRAVSSRPFYGLTCELPCHGWPSDARRHSPTRRVFSKTTLEQFDKECEPFAPEMISYLQNLPWQKSSGAL
jgi:transcriptional regulator of aromatic amino acid metabolism